jgi:CubicO group peptidase (beta-lactamase class C family)
MTAGDEGLDPEVAGALHGLVATRAERLRVPAIAYGVVRAGRLVAAAGVGNPGDGAGPPDARTLFRIASMTKSFTAAAVLRLRDAGRLRLDDAAATHVPSAARLRVPTSDSPAITLRHLLTMSSGLATDDPWADRHLDAAPSDLLGWLEDGAAFAAPPGTAFEYSNLGYGLLGQVVEAAGGMRLQEYVRRCFLEPLGMHDTIWDLGQARRDARVAQPHRLTGGAAVPDAPPIGDGALGPMGGLWSTVSDLAIWVGFLADAFPPRDGADDGPLCRASRREMQQVSRAIPAAVTREEVDGRLRLVAGGYGMGLEVREHLQLGAMVTHSGGLPGFASNMRWLPDRGVGIVALTNLTYVPMSVLTRDCLELLHDCGALPAASRPPAPALERAATEVAALLSAWDPARAVRLFADNVAPDLSLDHRAVAAASLRDRHGAFSVESVEADRATRGRADLAGERGRIRVAIQLAPLSATPVQRYEITSIVAPSPALRDAAAHLARFAGTGAAQSLGTVLDPHADHQSTARQLAAAHALFGDFTVGTTVDCPGVDAAGAERATIRWHGERGDVDITLARSADGVRVERLAPRPLPDP